MKKKNNTSIMFKKIKSKLVSSVLVMVLATGCAEGDISKQNAGTVVGAGLGAIAGSAFGGGEGKIIASVVGAGLGGYIGNKVGLSLDRADAAYYNQTMTQSLEYNKSGVRSTWKNPDSGNHGSITPRTSYVEGGRDCREYVQEVYIGGRKKQAFGKACRRSNGDWEIIS
jgi:surface antigen